MPDQSSAADEHAILQEITAPLSTLPADALPIAAEPDFPVVLRGYDRVAVDAYVKRTSQLVAELQSTRSPEAAVRRALERVGEQISGILKRAHETAEQITVQSRREAEDRLEAARVETINITASAEERVKELDAETDRIWAERHRIVNDARDLASQLQALATAAAARFPPAGESTEVPAVGAAPPSARAPSGAQPPISVTADDADVDDERLEDAGDEPVDEAGPPSEADSEGPDDGDVDVERTDILPPLHPDDLRPPGSKPER